MFNGESARPTTGRLLTTVSPVTYSLPAQLPLRTRSKSKREESPPSRVSYSTSFLSHRNIEPRVVQSVAIYRRATELIIRVCPVSRDTACVHRVSRLRQSRDRLTVSDTRIRSQTSVTALFCISRAMVCWKLNYFFFFFFF